MSAFSGEIANPGTYNTDVKRRVARATLTASSAATTSEVGVLRLDGVKVLAGHTYTIRTSSLLVNSTVANDVVAAKLRISTTDTATTSSTDYQSAQVRCTGSTVLEDLSVLASYNPASDETLSILLTVVRASGTGSVSMFGASNARIEILVDHDGEDPGNTGTVP